MMTYCMTQLAKTLAVDLEHQLSYLDDYHLEVSKDRLTLASTRKSIVHSDLN